MPSILFHQGVTILLLTGWFLITTGVGRLCLSMTTIGFASRSEQLFLSFGIGFIATGYAVFFLGVTQALHPATLTMLLGALGLLAMAGWLREFPCGSLSPAISLSWNRPAAWLLAAVLLAGFLLVLTPEIGKDALIYHLAVPKLYLRHHGFYFIPGNVFAGYPLLGEMHYVLALFLQNDILAKAMHYAVLCGTIAGIQLFVRVLMREHVFANLSMLIFASLPSVFTISHAAYNDLFVTFFTLATIYTFLRWSEERGPGWLILCAIFAGSSAACKYTALLLTPLGCLGILWICSRQKTNPPESLHRIAVYAAVAFVCGSPFYLKNWIMTGNPFYPFFYDLFGGVGWDADQARMYDLFIQNLGMGRSFIDYLLLPWNLSFRAQMDSPRFDGILGPVFFLTLPFLAGLKQWETPVRVLLVYTVATFLFWASSAQQIRYLIPLFSLLAIVTGAILTRYREKKWIFRFLIFITAGSLAFNGYHMVRDFLKIRPISYVIGLESRDDFLMRLIPPYSMYRFINRELPPESLVFLIYMKNFTFLCERACYSDAMFETHTLHLFLSRALSPEEVHDRLKIDGFTHLLYDEAYLLSNRSPLTTEEKTLFMTFREKYLTRIRQNDSYRLDRLN